MSAPAISIPQRRGRLGAYAAWQARDFVWNTAIISIILFGLLGALSLMAIDSSEAFYAMRKPPQQMPVAAKLNIFLQLYGIFATVGPIICLSGIVSQDRISGFTRFLFAKPISPRLFYLQSFIVRLLGFLVLAHLLLLTYGYFQPPVYTPRFLADLTIAFMAIGGIMFLLSVVTRYDGLIAVVLFLVSSMVWSKWGTAKGPLHAVTYALPPIEKFSELHQWTIRLNALGSISDVEFPMKWALWLTSYGLACLVLGLYLLRKVPLTKA